MARSWHWVGLLAAPLLSSCVFLLDFDELQGGPEPTSAGGAPSGAGAPGDAAGAGHAGEGDAGAAPIGCSDCSDGDPCTIDTCDETSGVPTCSHEATEGLASDGFETTLTSRQHVRVSAVAGGQQFFFSVLASESAGPRVGLYGLASDGSELRTLGADLKLDGVPLSNVGLAVEELPLGEVALHGFVATKLKLAAATPKVFHVSSRNDRTTVNVVGNSYWEGNPTTFPQALSIGASTVGAWIQADGTIAIHNVGAARTDTFGATTLPATTLALLSTADSQPAVMYTASAGERQALGTFVETSGQNRTKLAECESRAGDYLSSTVIGTQIPGLWLASVTRVGSDYLTTGSGTLVCGANACAAVAEDCAKATPSNNVRNVAGATVRFEADPPGIIYSVVAIPQVAIKDDLKTVEGRLSLALGRTDFSNPKAAESTTLGGDENGVQIIARNDTTEQAGFAGPDWPAVAILPTKQVAIAWIQPSQTSDGTELHVRRYKMCLPEP